MFSINELITGQGYELKDSVPIAISIQVGKGGDCGVFIGKCNAETFLHSPSFRVIVNQKNLRKFWKKKEIYDLATDLQKYQVYGDIDIGTQNRYAVTLEDIDNRIPISEPEFEKLEQLSVWETIHIIDRVMGNYNR